MAAIARQIAEIDAQIAQTELRIVRHQKTVENLLAKGRDTAKLTSAIAELKVTLANLEYAKVRLEKEQRTRTAR